ncbi:hypothetical protein NX059_001119 [Plenodomus lindquistii]|nr:hypothetical protein NX059_001119 [Plenodomus lindquistii]
MLFSALTLAFAGLAHAQSVSDSSAKPSVSQTSSLSTRTSSSSSSEKPETTSILLPFYAPYPISNAPSFTPSESASLARPTTSSIESDKFWQHEYRDYYASIITVISTSTLVYAIDCAPNSAHPSYSAKDFQSFAVCGAGVVGRGPMTVTQGPNQWNFAITQAEPSLSLTQSQFIGQLQVRY